MAERNLETSSILLLLNLMITGRRTGRQAKKATYRGTSLHSAPQKRIIFILKCTPLQDIIPVMKFRLYVQLGPNMNTKIGLNPHTPLTHHHYPQEGFK